jgi:hypothetical protein
LLPPLFASAHADFLPPFRGGFRLGGMALAAFLGPRLYLLFELKLRSCAGFLKECTEVLRLTQGQRVTATNDWGNGWVKISVRTNEGGTVVGFVNRKFLHFDGY